MKRISILSLVCIFQSSLLSMTNIQTKNNLNESPITNKLQSNVIINSPTNEGFTEGGYSSWGSSTKGDFRTGDVYLNTNLIGNMNFINQNYTSVEVKVIFLVGIYESEGNSYNFF
ncbi:hypothetical protein [Spiroplasma taiwanense]|uniref:Uncharacterized protein n=1 Tax=Spiroplasma taiwanense CT-1 TaxID=1276220 RepID=S5MC32_9MOLU|nr:hypothetical protein [Spiroplasma taiwanense]AGR41288.1 hypothetical protein STAIW_v1c06700 [Spiroplasma taiwanense CT-1]